MLRASRALLFRFALLIGAPAEQVYPWRPCASCCR